MFLRCDELRWDQYTGSKPKAGEGTRGILPNVQIKRRIKSEEEGIMVKIELGMAGLLGWKAM